MLRIRLCKSYAGREAESPSGGHDRVSRGFLLLQELESNERSTFTFWTECAQTGFGVKVSVITVTASFRFFKKVVKFE